jgi:hypothetical protein
VINRQGEWFEIALNEEYAWVRVQDADTRYLPVERLLRRSLAYLYASAYDGAGAPSHLGDTFISCQP